jgi:hypothetical protein
MISIFRDNDLEGIPALYEQDGKGDKAKVSLMVKIPYTGFIWLLTEYSKEEQLFFGFCCLNDIQMAELGYVSKVELEDLGKQYPLVIEKIDMTLKEAKEKYIIEEDE